MQSVKFDLARRKPQVLINVPPDPTRFLRDDSTGPRANDLRVGPQHPIVICFYEKAPYNAAQKGPPRV